MRFIRSLVLLSWILAVPALRADVTVSYHTDFNTQAKPAADIDQTFLPNTVIQIKGSKAFSNTGMRSSMIDLIKQEITILDPKTKLFTTVSMKDFVGEMNAAIQSAMPALPNMSPAARQILDSITGDLSSRKTGRTDTILGIQAEETEWILTIALPVPAGLPLPPGMLPSPGQPVTILKVVMQLWSAAPEEIDRVPALHEWVAYSSSSFQLLNPFAALQQLAASLPLPAIGKTLSSSLQQLTEQKAPMLKAHMEISSPVLVQIAPLAKAGGSPLPPDFDPAASLAKADTVATEISSAPVDDSVFVLPSDYHPTPLADLVKAGMPTPRVPLSPAATHPPAKP